jgi:hypothetical protein
VKKVATFFLEMLSVSLWQGTAIGVEQQEEDHGDGHDVHVEQEDDAAVVEAPLEPKAAHSVEGAGDGDDGGYGEPWVRMCVGKSRQKKGKHEAAQHEQGAAEQGFLAKVEEARLMDTDWKRGGDDYFSLVLCGQAGVAAFGGIKRELGAILLRLLAWSHLGSWLVAMCLGFLRR